MHADRGCGNSVSASVTGFGCNAGGSCKCRALSCVFISCTNQRRVVARLRRYVTANSPRVTLIRGKTNDRGPPRPPTEAETFLIISGLMKPRAAEDDPCTRVCVRHKRGSKRENVCCTIAFGCLPELSEVADRPDASFSIPPRPAAPVDLANFHGSLRVILCPGIIVSYG